MMFSAKICFVMFALLTEQWLYGEGHFDVYQNVASMLGVPSEFSCLIASVFITFLLVVFGLFFRGRVEEKMKRPHPDENFTFFSFLEECLDFVFSLAKDQCGHAFVKVLPVLCTLFLFILMSNLSGLVPGFIPPTELFSFNLALGFVAFLTYNYAGFCEHGFAYLKQLLGPFLILAPLFLVLETISHLARPLSLSFRLAANIFGDHLLLGVFSHMVPLVVPAFLMCFGLLVAFIQSFVFTVLTSIYIGMAVSHDH